MKAKLIKKEDGYNLAIEQPQGRLLEATCSPSEQLRLDKSGASTKYKLSKQNCDEIFGVVDVEKLAENHPLEVSNASHGFGIKDGIVYGFNKALELNRDKVFTIDDIDKAIEWATVNGRKGDITHYGIDNFIQSLQQPTEIEVEIEIENKEYILNQNGEGFEDQSYRTWEKVPRLDSKGCLILKK
jgi:hypothetical protein